MKWCSERRGGVDEEVVAEFECGLIVAAAGGSYAAGSDDRDLGVVDEDVWWFVCLRRCRGEGAVAFAGVGAAFAVEVEGVGGGRPRGGGVPVVFVQGEVADAWLGGEFAGVFEPVIEPAEEEGVGVEVGCGAEVLRRRRGCPRGCEPRGRRGGIGCRGRAAN